MKDSQIIEQIQAWVQEKYNKLKSSDSKQPGCPEDKTRAIEAALKHFQMI